MAQSKRMEQEQVIAAPAVLSPRSRSRKATKEWKENQRSRNPAAYKAKRAEQERNRLRKQKEREAAKAAFAAEEYVPSVTIPPHHAAAAAHTPLSSVACSGNLAVCGRTFPMPPPSSGAAVQHFLPYGLTPPPRSPIPPPLLSPASQPFTPLAPLTLAPPAPPAPPPAPSARDGRTFEQKKIKELEAKIQSLEDAVRTRDAELEGYADTLFETVRAATEQRDNLASASIAIRGYMYAFPHKPEGPCDCVFCVALSFLAPALKQRAACTARMRAEKDA